MGPPLLLLTLATFPAVSVLAAAWCSWILIFDVFFVLTYSTLSWSEPHFGGKRCLMVLAAGQLDPELSVSIGTSSGYCLEIGFNLFALSCGVLQQGAVDICMRLYILGHSIITARSIEVYLRFLTRRFLILPILASLYPEENIDIASSFCLMFGRFPSTRFI